MPSDILPDAGPALTMVIEAASAALTREAERIALALDRVPEEGARRDALKSRGEALTALLHNIAEKPSVAAQREAAVEIERIGRRLSATAQNANEGGELLSLAQSLTQLSEAAIQMPVEVTQADVLAIETSEADAAPDATPEAENAEGGGGKAPEPAAAADAADEVQPAPAETEPRTEALEQPSAKQTTKLEPMDKKMNQISEIEAATDLQDEVMEEQSGKKSDEALAGAWMSANMPKMNKVARNRYGDGKEVCLVANRSASRDQRNVIANLPTEALDWARSARRPVKLVLFIRYPDDTSMRVVTATMTTAVALATPGKAAKATISLWDEFGDVEKANGVMACEGSTESALSDIEVASTVIA